MLNRHYFIIGLLILSCLKTYGQTQLDDSLNAMYSRQEYPFIIIPAYYEKLSQKFPLSEINNSDNISFRLWSTSMVGYGLLIFRKSNNRWDSHKLKYYSDTSIREVKIFPTISTTEFVNKLQAVDFSTFISQYQIEDFKDNVDDGVRYTLELIIGKTYKVVQYHSPDSFTDANNVKFYSFIQLIDKYFHE